MSDTDRPHYNVGWNDTSHGLSLWTKDVGETPLEWAERCRKIAVECQPNAIGSHNRAYYQGVIDCVDEFKANGRVARKN